MKIKKRTKINKPLIAAALVVIVGILVFLAYSLVYNHPKNDTADTTAPKEATSDEQQSANLEKNPENKSVAPNADRPSAPAVSKTSSKKQVQMAASTNTSVGIVYIRGGVNYPVVGGSCFAQLSGPSGQSIRKDTTVLQNPASADCKTISIPTSELASGKWTFTLHYTSDDYEGVSNEISFTI